MGTKRYFVVDRYRYRIDTSYVKKFLAKEKNIKFHSSFKEARQEQHNGFYDDSDYGVFSIDENNKIERHS